MSPERIRARHSSDHSGKKQGSFEIALPVRLVFSAVLVIISALFQLPVWLRTVLLVVSVVSSGYDVFLAAVDEIADKRYFSTELVIVFAAVLSFVIGFPTEAAIMVILYQLSKIVFRYTKNKSIDSARALLSYQDNDIQGRVEEIISDGHPGEMRLQRTIETSATFVLRLLIVFALIYAIALPLLTGISFRVSIHRALMILLASSPVSVAISFPIIVITGLCFAARNGVVFSSVGAMEKACDLNVALFDKDGVFSDEAPHLIGLQSDVLDKKTFLHFLAHATYYSDQPFAKAISDYYDQEYRLDLVSDFKDIPGYGVSVSIGGAPVVLASKVYYDEQGIEVPERGFPEGIPYYLTVADRYVGRVVISAEIDQDAVGLVEDMQMAGIPRNILITEDGKEQSQSVAESLHFTEVVGECDMDRKLRLISDISQDEQNCTTFIYANGIEGHSAADLDIRISRKGKYADVIVLPDYYLNIPHSFGTCRRVKELFAENAIFIFVVKAILIFLSIIGYSNLWFVVFIDTVAALATILNAIRVTMPSLLQGKSER
ncbi:MAG: HAD family hydrolase [Oscillospiraceae bacterium]|nr:HAD family hydrolase [Oscillospiraceae bacterium]